MYNKPREAKRLYFDVIPRAVDDYAAFLSAYQRQADKPVDRLMNPVWHIHEGNPPLPEEGGISFALLLNLAAVANAHDKSALWGFIQRYQPALTPETHPRLDLLAKHALRKVVCMSPSHVARSSKDVAPLTTLKSRRKANNSPL
jgi:lysyl-tRNA synthetase class 1